MMVHAVASTPHYATCISRNPLDVAPTTNQLHLITLLKHHYSSNHMYCHLNRIVAHACAFEMHPFASSVTGAKAKSLRDAKALDERALTNYMKELDGVRGISAIEVNKVCSFFSFFLPACTSLTYLQDASACIRMH